MATTIEIATWLLLAFLVALSIILAVVRKRSDTSTTTGGKQSTSASEEGIDGTTSPLFPWFDESRLDQQDLQHLSGLRISIEHWLHAIRLGNLPYLIGYRTDLASITRGRFRASLTYELGSYTIVLRDAQSGTEVLIDSISHSTGESNG